ncbi:hypothetical protein BALCAV_0204560 [Alkalihalobacillus alcalophilus ATCC 27647 = CGMCC 1.3604]|uniref:Uncharacterized protein n=1 Tax=Alkalihalobacillus alcalophilus ATCC 27647 = CGMCC 1.3604 TaxID=1218173 RepID=A0A094WKU3_ALKAL|nr:hypothetical protein [Alkalihalobacillus alcalophilus]KGA98359.1 hypothetical protein BALCAV_0204560 [Alkalihalobacillus alcalophilus ATCC 27647 = CGMCC 1.3604]
MFPLQSRLEKLKRVLQFIQSFFSDIEKVHRQLRKQDVIVTDIVQVGANTFFDLFDLDGNRLQICFC